MLYILSTDYICYALKHILLTFNKKIHLLVQCIVSSQTTGKRLAFQ